LFNYRFERESDCSDDGSTCTLDNDDVSVTPSLSKRHPLKRVWSTLSSSKKNMLQRVSSQIIRSTNDLRKAAILRASKLRMPKFKRKPKKVRPPKRNPELPHGIVGTTPPYCLQVTAYRTCGARSATKSLQLQDY
jgi:hypothetical protein